MNKLFFIIFTVFYFKLSFGQQFSTIEDEVKYNKKKSEVKEQMAKEQHEAQEDKANLVRDNAYVLFCNPLWNGLYAFYKGRVYRDWRPGSINEVDMTKARFDKSLPYVKKGDVITWKSDQLSNITRLGETFEFHLNNNMIYRKIAPGDITEYQCKLVQDLNKP